MFFYHFLQLCPRGHISKMLAVTVIKNTVTKRLWNFQIRFLPYSNVFEEKFFFSNMFLYHFLQLCPRGHISKMLAVTVIKNTRLLSAFGIFKSISCLIQMCLRKIFFSNMFLYHFLQLCPRGHISKMLAVTVIKNTRLLSAFGIFKSISCLIRMRLRQNFFFKHVLLSFSSTLSPRPYLENACCNRY